MALTKDKKNAVVADAVALFGSSKMTVVATYPGTTVKAMQTLRRQARENGTSVHVIKNRLIKKAIEKNDQLKGVDTSLLTGQLLYAFNPEDEVSPAQALANFAKTNPTIEFVGAITADGKFLSKEEVKSLAILPSKDQLIGQVVAMLLSPVNDITNALSGNLHALLDGVSSKASV